MGSITRLVCLIAGLAGLAFGGALRVEAAVTLVDFNASVPAGKVVLNWVTASEVKTVGFNLYRSTSKAGPYTKVNAALIGSKGTVTGGNYSYTDPVASNLTGYYYRLEEVELDGTVTTVATFPEESTPTPTVTPPATATLAPPTATPTVKSTSTSTPVPAATSTRVPVAAATPVPVATATPVAVATATPAPAPTLLPAPAASATPVAATGPVSAASAAGTGGAGAGDPDPGRPVGFANSASQSGTPGPVVGDQGSAKPQPTAPSATATRAGEGRAVLAATSTPVATATPGTLALASGPAGTSMGGQDTVSSKSPSAQVAEPESLPRDLSLVDMGAGGLVVLGILGILASLVWSLVRYRRI